MRLEGGCYCGRLRYLAEGKPLMKGQCHCRPCQYASGGAPNLFMLVPAVGFSWTRGKPERFARADLENPVTREFCATCGTHVANRPAGLSGVVLKVGTLDDPDVFRAPRVAMFTSQRRAFHHVPDDVTAFEGMPAE